MRAFYTIILLLLSNAFMNLAWYGHLKFKDIKALSGLPLVGVVLISWGIALLDTVFRCRPTGWATRPTVALSRSCSLR